jgi:predicted secreted protein
MSVFTGIIVYLLLYWTALFAILPWGNQAADVPEEGHMGGAPINPRIKQKFLITGIVAAILWVIVFAAVHYGIIDFRGIARQMVEEDKSL